jgi:type I restriction enzyme S subunit
MKRKLLSLEFPKWNLPKGWNWTTLVGVATGQKNAIVDGPFGSNLKVSDYISDSNGVPVLTTKNLEHGYDNDKVRHISKEKFEEVKRSEVRGGDIIVAKIGSCGKTGIYPENLPSAIIPANLLKFTVSNNVNKLYVYYYLNSPSFTKLLQGITTATAQPAFNVTKFRKLPIPIPSLTEQERIVARIEELFTQLDAGTAALRRVQAELKRFRVSILKSAFNGNKPIICNDKDGKLPYEWCLTTIGEVADTKSGGTPLRKCPKYFQGHIPWVKSGELGDGFISQTEEKITSDAIKHSSAKLFPCGTVLVALYGVTVGKVGILKIDAASNQAVCALFPKKDTFTPKYMFYWLMSQRQELIKKSMGGAQPNISQGIIRSHPFPLVPLIEQHKIIAELEGQLSIITEADMIVEATLMRSKRLRQSILRSAFEGRL